VWKCVRPQTFFGFFFAFFPVDSNSASNFAFYGTHIEFLQKFFLGFTVLALFAKFKAEPSSLGRYVFGSEISYNKAPPRLPGLGC
jgi:hypothetical protein